MVPVFFLDICFETRRQLGLFVLTTHTAMAARHSGPAARTGELAFPGLFRMVFTHPSPTIAEYTLHHGGLDLRLGILHHGDKATQ
jgi:hypothetical protein